ncbi:MAG: hypothetical protein ACLR13_00040 [Acutalibacteraceae bacterium]
MFIKNIIPSRMKIKLIIIDTFEYQYRPSAPKYFMKEIIWINFYIRLPAATKAL